MFPHELPANSDTRDEGLLSPMATLDQTPLPLCHLAGERPRPLQEGAAVDDALPLAPRRW